MSLRIQLNELLAAMHLRVTLKETWLELTRAQSDEQYDVRRQHLAQDDLCEAKLAELVGTLQTSQEGGMIEFDLMVLDDAELDKLRSILDERGLFRLLQPSKPENLHDLVRAWRQASFTLDAARYINQLRMSCVAADLPRAIEEGAATCRNEDGWKRAVATYLAFRSKFIQDSGIGGAEVDNDLPVTAVVNDDDLNAEATHANMRHWLARYDNLREQLSVMVERLQSSNSLSYQLDDMELDDRRALINAIDGGLVPQLQTQTQTKARPQVATMVAEKEETAEDGDVD